MAKVQNISEIHPTLGFTEFDILEKYRKSFNESEQRLWACRTSIWGAGIYSVPAQRLPLWS